MTGDRVHFALTGDTSTIVFDGRQRAESSDFARPIANDVNMVVELERELHLRGS